ncbi:uncharacterized protein LOC120308450 [Crotalus tigris]|uniref:uncharacterized protein LOC120308450 n=1 Tax=Crotalus tigris TaxID=88082 RepID=UPI00192F29F6|nr:uncharacterized protein LOC120308450 [Crotalus tigris]
MANGSGPGSVQGNRGQVWCPNLRPFCLPNQQTTTKVPFQVPVSISRGDRCPSQSLAQGTAVCLPSLSAPSSHDPQDFTRAGGSSPGRSSLATMTVVRAPGGAIHLTPMEDSGRSYHPHTRGYPAPGPAVAQSNHLALERQALSHDSYSSRVIAVIQQSRRASTNRIYDATWKSFCNWCSGHKVEFSSVSVPIVLKFLMDGLDKGLSPSTIHRQVAALATVLICENATPLTHHPLVRSFLKGANNAKPPPVHRYPSWDLEQVLQALIAPPFEPMETCSLDLLLMKVAFLVAITSARPGEFSVFLALMDNSLQQLKRAAQESIHS